MNTPVTIATNVTVSGTSQRRVERGGRERNTVDVHEGRLTSVDSAGNAM